MHDHDWIMIGEDTSDSIYWCTRCGALGKPLDMQWDEKQEKIVVTVELTESPSQATRDSDGLPIS